jgi:dihydrofolate reductase
MAINFRLVYKRPLSYAALVKEGAMRRLRYSVAMSLDGYIAGPDGEADWILMDPDIDFGAIFSEYDTLLMGRGTFRTSESMGGGSGAGGVKSVVVSRTLKPEDHPGVTIIADDVKRRVMELKAEPGKDIWLFGGGQLFRSLLDAGVVDTVEVAVIPVLLGGGVPLLPPPGARVSLTLTSHRVYAKTGTVSLAYDVARPAKDRGRR